jgi:hypothetical protein
MVRGAIVACSRAAITDPGPVAPYNAGRTSPELTPASRDSIEAIAPAVRRISVSITQYDARTRRWAIALVGLKLGSGQISEKGSN